LGSNEGHHDYYYSLLIQGKIFYFLQLDTTGRSHDNTPLPLFDACWNREDTYVHVRRTIRR